MGHKCFISFKKEDEYYKKEIQKLLNKDMIDKSLNTAIESEDEDYVLSVIRKEYLSDSTVTIFLIGSESSENKGYEEQKYIKRELQASLFHGKNNTKNGILGVVLPHMTDKVFLGSVDCKTCLKSHNSVNVSDNLVIKEFSYNYYIPNQRCSWREEDRYCVLVSWENFILSPTTYIDKAFEKRNATISNKTRVRP
jgi:hypothetical protein